MMMASSALWWLATITAGPARCSRPSTTRRIPPTAHSQRPKRGAIVRMTKPGDQVTAKRTRTAAASARKRNRPAAARRTCMRLRAHHVVEGELVVLQAANGRLRRPGHRGLVGGED